MISPRFTFVNNNLSFIVNLYSLIIMRFLLWLRIYFANVCIDNEYTLNYNKEKARGGNHYGTVKYAY